MINECVLATLPGENPHEQVIVVLSLGTESKISLRQQTWGEGIGWYTQKTIDLDPQQAGQLRVALGQGGVKVPVRRPSVRPIPEYLQLMQVESA